MPIIKRRVEQSLNLVDSEVLHCTGGPGVSVVRSIECRFCSKRTRSSSLVDHYNTHTKSIFHDRSSCASRTVSGSTCPPRHDQIDRSCRIPRVVTRSLSGSGSEQRGHGKQNENRCDNEHLTLSHVSNPPYERPYELISHGLFQCHCSTEKYRFQNFLVGIY